VPAALLQFAREIKSRISDDTIADIRSQWDATGRLAVSCGPAGRKGLSGIFTLDPAGRPVIWAPKDGMNGSVRGRLRKLVAAGGGGVEVPAGYEALEPKAFEERAGKANSRNWQLSILLTGRLLEHVAEHGPGCCCRLQDAWAQGACKLSKQRRALLAVTVSFCLRLVYSANVSAVQHRN
jgi:hypothetical protein